MIKFTLLRSGSQFMMAQQKKEAKHHFLQYWALILQGYGMADGDFTHNMLKQLKSSMHT